MSSARRVGVARAGALVSPDAARSDEYLTVAEVAARLKLTPKTVRNRMYSGTWRRGEHWFSRTGIGPRFKWSALVRWVEGAEVEQGRGDGLAYGPDIPRDRPRQTRVDRPRSAVV
jgi:hypothetical protein